MEGKLVVHSFPSDHRIWENIRPAETSCSKATGCGLLCPSTPTSSRYKPVMSGTGYGDRDPVLYCTVPPSFGLAKCCSCDGGATLYLRSAFLKLTSEQIGQAMRIALVQGMHTDMPVVDLGESVVQRCRKIWWTVYILDRQMTSLMGLPQSVRDDDVSCQLPNFGGSAQRAAGLGMQIKLARIYSEISRSMPT